MSAPDGDPIQEGIEFLAQKQKMLGPEQGIV